MQLKRGPELTPFDNIDINACYRNYVPTMCERSLVPSFMIRSWWDLDSPGDRNNFPATFRVVLGPETIKCKTELTASSFGHPDTSDNNDSSAELPRPQFRLEPQPLTHKSLDFSPSVVDRTGFQGWDFSRGRWRVCESGRHWAPMLASHWSTLFCLSSSTSTPMVNHILGS